MSLLSEYREETRSLLARLRLHCEICGMRPPAVALRRYASLRWVESRWYLEKDMDQDRRDLLESLAAKLRLFDLRPDSPLCRPDLPDCTMPQDGAPWPDAPLMIGVRDL